MTSEGSVTRWIDGLMAGDQAANEVVWKRFHRQLLAVAKAKLTGGHRREADEEDVVQNAFHSFYRRVSDGQFPHLADRDSLWRLLVVMTARKSIDQLRRDYRGKKSGTPNKPNTISPKNPQLSQQDLDELISRDPSPAFAAEIVEEFSRLLDALCDSTLQSVAIWKMEGLTNDEIATQLGCSRRTVARKLDSIRTIWHQKNLA